MPCLVYVMRLHVSTKLLLFVVDREVNRKLGGTQLKVPSVDKLKEAYEVKSSNFYFVKLMVALSSFYSSFTKHGFKCEAGTR